MYRKLVISTSVIILSLLGELLLWNNVILLSIVFIILAIVKHRIYPIKKELFWFLLISIGGGIIEIIMVNFGHGWVYSNPNFWGIPLWIPLFWGLMGTTVIVLYDAITNIKRY